MMWTKPAVLSLIVVVAVVSAGILMVSFSGEASGKVSIYVKDAPAGWDHIDVEFSEVWIHQAGEGDETGWIQLGIDATTVDLAELTDVSALLASADVPVGKYTQLRFVIDSVTGTNTDGEVFEFKVPSGVLKTNHPFTISDDDDVRLVIDFDLEKSIGHNAQGWFFKPVIGSIIED